MVKTPEIGSEDAVSERSTRTLPAQKKSVSPMKPEHQRFAWLKQVARFGLVGGLNTLIDMLVLNSLLFLFPTTSLLRLVVYNTMAYIVGATNSFLGNKYWTFGKKQSITRGELLRFVTTTLLGSGCSSTILWLCGLLLHPVLLNPTAWANASKVLAIAATTLISYLGMRLWVFAGNKTQQEPGAPYLTVPAAYKHGDGLQPTIEMEALKADGYNQAHGRRQSISVVLPAYNEEQVIATTLSHVLNAFQSWQLDYEILVVNDGSSDRTGEIVASLARSHPQICLIHHATNQGYGAALVSGFQAAKKDFTFFMDSDGQFDVRSLQDFFPYMHTCEAVIGYRIKREDTWIRKCNAWGWNALIRIVMGVRVRDIDCAFKLLRSDFLHETTLETRGAMINAELLYKFQRCGFTYQEIGVLHFPRLGGRATGAHPRVIIRAFRDLFTYANRWKREEKAALLQAQATTKDVPSHMFQKGHF